MGEEIALENGRDLDLDLGWGHTAYCHASLVDSTYIPNFIAIEGSFCVLTDVRTDGRTFETGFIRSTRRSRPKNVFLCSMD